MNTSRGMGMDKDEKWLLVHENLGWKAYPYIWDDNDLDATLTLVGGEKIVKWKKDNKKNEIKQKREIRTIS